MVVSRTTVDANVHLAATLPPTTAVGAAGWPSDWAAGSSLTVEAYLREMAGAGVDHAVAVTPIRVDGFDNDSTIDAAARFPDRLTAVGNLDVLAPGAADRLVDEVARGLRGVRFFGGDAVDAAAWLDDPRAAECWRRAGEAGVPVSAQRTRLATLPALARMVARFPEVPVVVYSMADPPLDGGPPFTAAEPLLALARFPGVHLNLAPGNLAPAEFLPLVVDRFGPRRLMWGSYSQFGRAREGSTAADLGDVVAAVAKAFSFLTDTDRAWILGDTAASLYRAPEGG